MVIDWTTKLAEMDDLTVRHYCETAHLTLVREAVIPNIDLGYGDHPQAQLIWQTACEMFADDMERADRN